MPIITLADFKQKNPNAIARDYIGNHLVSTVMRLRPDQCDDGLGRFLTYSSIDGLEQESCGLADARACHVEALARTRDRAENHGHDGS